MWDNNGGTGADLAMLLHLCQAAARNEGAKSHGGGGEGGWGGVSWGQPPVSGQSPAFSVSLVDVSVLGRLQKPLLAQRMPLGFRLTENTPFAFNHLPFPAQPAYRMFCSCLTHHPSQSWDLKTKCWLWRRNSQPLTHSWSQKCARVEGTARTRELGGAGVLEVDIRQRERPPGAGSPWGLLVPRQPSAKVRRAERAGSPGAREGPAHAWEETLASPSSPR